MTSNSNSFAVLNSISKEKLCSIASDSGIILGENVLEIDNQIETILAKEQAEAVLAANRLKVRKDREKKKLAEGDEPIGLASFELEGLGVSTVGIDNGDAIPNPKKKNRRKIASENPVSPLAEFEKQIETELRLNDLQKSPSLVVGTRNSGKKKRGRPRNFF